MKLILSFVVILFVSTVLQAQEKLNEPQMADTFRSNGKIYVVIAVILVIFAGIIAYLIHLDRKISRIEKNHNEI
jgi:uncharacterized membrane protein